MASLAAPYLICLILAVSALMCFGFAALFRGRRGERRIYGLVGFVVADVLLASPIVFSQYPDILVGLPFGVYDALGSVLFDGRIGDLYKTLQGTPGAGAGWPIDLYAGLLVACYAATPIFAALTVFSYITRRLSHMTLRYRIFCARHLNRELYLFSGLNDRTLAVVRSIYGKPWMDGETVREQHRAFRKVNRSSLCIVANVEGEAASRRGEDMNELRDMRVVCVADSAQSVYEEFLASRLTGRFGLHVYFIDDDGHRDYVADDAERTHNVGNAVSFIESVASGISNLMTSESCCDPLFDHGKPRFHFYCTSHGESDDTTFDSITGLRGLDPYSSIYGLRRDITAATASGTKGLDIRTVDPYRDAIYQLLWERPLHEALGIRGESLLKEPLGEPHVGPIEGGRSGGREAGRTLHVVIVGCGNFGLEALRGCLWAGQIPHVRLRIHVIDSMGCSTFLGQFRHYCPGFFEGRRGVARVREVDGNLIEAEPFFTLQYHRADVTTSGFDEEIRAIRDQVHDGAVPSPSGALLGRPYCIVALGNDDLNVETAIGMRRLFAGFGDAPVVTPLISVQVSDRRMYGVVRRLRAQGDATPADPVGSAIRNSVADGDAGNSGYNFYPFGALESVYDQRWLSHSPLSLIGLSINASYMDWLSDGRGPATWALMEENFVFYSAWQMTRLSNVSSACSFKTKLWLLGYALGEPSMELEPARPWEPKSRRLTPPMSRSSECTLDELDKLLRTMRHELAVDEDGGTLSEGAIAFQVLAVNEHMRWEAFYMSEGWKGITASESLALREQGLTGGRYVSHLLRLHPLICAYDELRDTALELYGNHQGRIENDRRILSDMARILGDWRSFTGCRFPLSEI